MVAKDGTKALNLFTVRNLNRAVGVSSGYPTIFRLFFLLVLF